jgi:hypothetical protein
VGLCTKCKVEPTRDGQRWGKRCHAAYQRENRRSYAEMSDEQKERIRARAYANVYLRRGKIQRGPCADCGGPGEEMHHEDYSKPLEITWLCGGPDGCHARRHA